MPGNWSRRGRDGLKRELDGPWTGLRANRRACPCCRWWAHRAGGPRDRSPLWPLASRRRLPTWPTLRWRDPAATIDRDAAYAGTGDVAAGIGRWLTYPRLTHGWSCASSASSRIRPTRLIASPVIQGSAAARPRPRARGRVRGSPTDPAPGSARERSAGRPVAASRHLSGIARLPVRVHLGLPLE